MAHHNLQEPLQTPPPLLNHTIIETVQVYFSWERGDGDARALALQQVAEDFEVRVAPPHFGAAQLEGRNVGRQADQVGCVARRGRGGGLVRLRVCYLWGRERGLGYGWSLSCVVLVRFFSRLHASMFFPHMYATLGNNCSRAPFRSNMGNVPQSPRNSPESHKSPRSSACAGLRLCSRSRSA
jgi:hypothetical protein